MPHRSSAALAAHASCVTRPSIATILLIASATAFGATSTAASANKTTPHSTHYSAARQVIELPLVTGWFDGREVHYVTTDVSDADAAAEMGANYVPRLANAIVPVEPGKPGALERIYRVANFQQGSILPSVPMPAGVANQNPNYSPLWRVSWVRWVDGSTPHLLRSEEEVLQAEERGWVTITKSDVVVNCPVIFSTGTALPNATIRTVGGK